MAKKSVDLIIATDPEWVRVIVENFDVFLQDHANCERKASALAMSMVMKYPDRTKIVPRLIALAREELEHFEQVYRIMQSRGLPLQKDAPDPYVNRLLLHCRHGRDERFLDRLLISSLVECRGAERFKLIFEALPDSELKHFYRDLAGSEAKHGHQFAEMALEYFDEPAVYVRLAELAALESEIVATLERRPSLH
jgi:tRNA-(ms[2]io[6]A)-hydroxylase